MKKFFTLIVVTMMVVASYAADVTIYVKADVAPYLFAWENGVIVNGDWPGTQMTEFTYVNDTKFWYKTFQTTGYFNIIFNDGAGYQTKDITGIASDHYFTYDGTTVFEDITEQYVEVTDADIEMVTLAGTFNGWSITSNPFTEVKKNEKYTCEWDLSDVDYTSFKVVVNGSAWLGYYNFGEAQERLIAPEGWLIEADVDGNLVIDKDAMGGVTKVLLTAEWVVGKNAEENWTLTITALNSNEGEGLLGDVNGDGLVDVTDVVLIIDYILGKKPADFIGAAADVNADGLINVTDVVMVIDAVLGKTVL